MNPNCLSNHCVQATPDCAFLFFLAQGGWRGRAGQFILVFPDQQIVAVFTGMNDNILMNQPLEMLQRYILPAALPRLANTGSK